MNASQGYSYYLYETCRAPMGDNCKSTKNLVKHYDLQLNAQGRFIWFTFKFKEVNILGLAEVAVAI